MIGRHVLTKCGLVAIFGLAVVFALGLSSQVDAGSIAQEPPVSPLVPNDNFVNATTIQGIPFHESVDNSAATVEPGESTPSCAYSWYFGKTVWYKYTPESETPLMPEVVPNGFLYSFIGVYTGNSIDALSEVACRADVWSSRVAFRPVPGVTYYFQIGNVYASESAPFTFVLGEAPQPSGMFYYYPGDPSVYEVVNFYDQSYDPANSEFVSFTWDFGDGATAEGPAPWHQYDADGDYTVTHTATTKDGRVAKYTQVVSIRTHDVAITGFTVPKAARAGVTKPIVVSISNKRFAENVEVQLLKSVVGPYGGNSVIGTLTLYVPVKDRRTTNFQFSYTCTPEDAQVGKVTFLANARLVSGRDAIPGDNSAISIPPTIVRSGGVTGAEANTDEEEFITVEPTFLSSMLYMPTTSKD